MNIKNIVLDRDGTIIEDRHYLHDPAGVRLLPGAARALAAQSAKGIRLFVATNQSGIGRGYFRIRDYKSVQEEMLRLLACQGAGIEKSVFCPHAPEEECSCRKPKTGMWESLSRECGLRPQETAVIGDKASDILFGRNSGLGLCILVMTGDGRKEAEKLNIRPPAAGVEKIPDSGPQYPDYAAADLATACTVI